MIRQKSPLTLVKIYNRRNIKEAFVLIDRGGDVNLQSNQSGRTIFHMALCAEVTDHEMVSTVLTYCFFYEITRANKGFTLGYLFDCSFTGTGC